MDQLPVDGAPTLDHSTQHCPEIWPEVGAALPDVEPCEIAMWPEIDPEQLNRHLQSIEVISGPGGATKFQHRPVPGYNVAVPVPVTQLPYPELLNRALQSIEVISGPGGATRFQQLGRIVPVPVTQLPYSRGSHVLIDFNGAQFWARVTRIRSGGSVDIIYDVDGTTENEVDVRRVLDHKYPSAAEEVEEEAVYASSYIPVYMPVNLNQNPGRRSYSATKNIGEPETDLDGALRCAVAEYGLEPGKPGFDWTQLMGHLPGYDKTPKQLKERWINYAKPGLQRGPWSDQEHRSLLDLTHIHGTRWAVIADMLGGRSPNDCKNRYHSHKHRTTGVKRNAEKADLAAYH